MSKPVRIALVADIHHGARSFTKNGEAAIPLLAKFKQFVAETGPDAVVDLGDRITDKDHETDLRLEQEVAAAFAGMAAPCHHICGNHDRNHLTVEENETALGQRLGSRVVDIGGWRLVLWAADSKIHRPGGLQLREADLLWLQTTIASADRPLAIMTHVPISGHSQTGNYWFERNPQVSTYPGIDRVRQILRTARVPMVCVAGHVHWNTLTTIDAIPHFTIQSLTETFTTLPEPAAAWALLELDDRIALTVYGRDSFHVRLDAATTARRWATPLPPFDQLSEMRQKSLANAAE